MTPSKRLRLPAEWEPQKSVLLSWPHKDTDWAYMLEAVHRCYTGLVNALSAVAQVIIVCPDGTPLPVFAQPERIVPLHIPTNDTWARDFGMICTSGETSTIINDFKFNGWGLKFAANHDNLITRRMLEIIGVPPGSEYANRLDFVLEGGSIESDGQGTILTTTECLLSPNRNGGLTKEEIQERLQRYFGAKKILWLGHGALEGDDTDSHIDTLARLCPGNTILYSSCDRSDDPHYPELNAMASQLATMTDSSGAPYRLIPLPIPEAIYDEEGQRLPATYANFLILNGTIFLPIYGDPKYDPIAIERVVSAMPGYKVEAIDCRALIQQHGSLHCATMQLPFTINM